jgi:hypothetical protein
VAGEGWIIVRPKTDTTGNAVGADWRVLSTQEVKQQGNKLVAEIDGEEVAIPGAEDDSAPLDSDDPVAIRVWESHPRRHMEADSAVRSSLTLLEELKLLNAAVAAIARSRLTGRGIVLVPQGTKFPTTPGQENEEDDLIEVLMTVAETAYKEPDSAAATVPIILEVPADQIPIIKRLTFESDFDSLAIQLREEAITRFANGLEVPAEILLGQGDINHWGQWALKDEAITLGVEPKLGTVADALTSQYLQPLLEAENVADALECLVWYDTSPLRVRTNRAETALKVHERGAISDAALRRETGFTDADAPTEEERAPRQEQPGNGDQELPVEESNAEPEQPTSDPAEDGPDVDLAAAAVAVDVQALRAQSPRRPVEPRPADVEVTASAANVSAEWCSTCKAYTLLAGEIVLLTPSGVATVGYLGMVRDLRPPGGHPCVTRPSPRPPRATRRTRPCGGTLPPPTACTAGARTAPAATSPRKPWPGRSGRTGGTRRTRPPSPTATPWTSRPPMTTCAPCAARRP